MFERFKRKKKSQLQNINGKTVCSEHYQEIIFKNSQEPSDVGIQLHQIMCEWCFGEGIVRPAVGIIVIKKRDERATNQ